MCSEHNLPASITEVINGTKKLQCRISWKIIATGYTSHGDWFDLRNEAMLQAEADGANARHAGKIEHWLEYK